MGIYEIRSQLPRGFRGPLPGQEGPLRLREVAYLRRARTPGRTGWPIFSSSRGLKKGDRVALFIENSAEYVVSYYAILKAGGTTVALNTENTADDIAYIIRDCGVRFLIAGHRLAARTLISGPAGRPPPSPMSRVSLEGVFVWNGPKDVGPEPAGPPRDRGSPRRWTTSPDDNPGRPPDRPRRRLDRLHLREHGEAPRRRPVPPEHRVEHAFDRRLPRADAGGPDPGRPAVPLHLRQVASEHALLRRRLGRRRQPIPLSQRRPPDHAGTGGHGIRRRAVDLHDPSQPVQPQGRRSSPGSAM